MIRNSDPLHAEHQLAHWTSVAKGAGVKLTHQRLEVFRELAGNEDHPDAESLFRAVRQRVPTVSLDTVYRTLWLLHDLGLITTLGPRREAIRFDVNLDRHHHFVCVRCGLVRDFKSDELDSLQVPEAVKGLGGVLDTRVEVRGVCANCQQAAPLITDDIPEHHERIHP
jgi:Fur family peroxide stress response transcriptional regulator